MKTWKTFTMAAIALVVAGCRVFVSDGPVVTATSPDGRNAIRLWTQPLAYEVSRDGVIVVAKTEIGMKVDGKCLTSGARCSVRKEKKSGLVDLPVYKKARIDLAGNETVADFGDWALRLAARDDGVAYRFETRMPGRIRVDCEKADVTIPCAGAKCAFSYGYRYGCEEVAPVTCTAGEIVTGKEKERQYAYLPFAYEVGGKHVAVTESDVFDYPIWNLKRTSGAGVTLGSEFAHFPKSLYLSREKDDNWDAFIRVDSHARWVSVGEFSDYLVETEGTRMFPWRTFVLADRPSDFCAADIVTALARGKADYDFSWVRPGKVAWDWWNAWDNVGVSNGCTTATYRRFIDFAAKAGVEYVILDEGWSESLDIWRFNPKVDVPEIIRYGNEKGVGIILWMAWAQVAGDEARVASHFAKLGAKGFKVDFMDRGDAGAERFLWTFADECAKNRMLVDYHGAHRPTGMSRAYPNVLNYEGVRGLEGMKWYRNEYDFLASDVGMFFLRMTAGPMDYTPGAMDNYPYGRYEGDRNNPGSVGTRCRQMAMMVLFEAPLQMLCDAPSKYGRNKECFAFMAATPVVWADTVGLGGTPDTFAAAARRAKDGAWYAAAISNRDGRDFTLDTSFLGTGDWQTEVFCDAADADAQPTHYRHERGRKVRAGEKLSFRLASGGGFVVRFSKSVKELKPLDVVLTFDDGVKDHLLVAAPELEKRGWRGIFCVVPDWIGKDEKHLSWDDVRELRRRGHEIANHTLSHADLGKLVREGRLGEARRQIAAGRDAIAKELGEAPKVLCIPFGSIEPEVYRIAAEEGQDVLPVDRANFGAGSGPVASRIDSHLVRADRYCDILSHGIRKSGGGWNPFDTEVEFRAHLDSIAAYGDRIRVVTGPAAHAAMDWHRRATAGR